jgi:DNA-binding response OmpR family regulator
MNTENEKHPLILLFGETDGLIKILKEIFTVEGYDVFMTIDSDTLLDLIDTKKPDVVILDVVVYSNNILQTIELIRNDSDVPVIILSGQSDLLVSRDLLTRDANGYITKPFRMRELLARVQAKLKQRQTDPIQ